MKTEIKKLPKSEIEIEFELTEKEFQEHFEHALEHLKHHVKVDGFRQGQAPAKMVEDKLKPEMLLMEAGDHAVKHVYTNYIIDNKLEPIGEPEVQITKIAKNNPFLFKVKITVLPDIDLPNYKEIASHIKGKGISVEPHEVEEALNYLQKTRAKFTEKNPSSPDGSSGRGDFIEIVYEMKEAAPQGGASLAPLGREIKDRFILGEGGFMQGFENGLMGMKAGEEKKIIVKFPENAPRKDLAGKDAEFLVKMISVQKMELPEINDEFAKQLGAFDTLVALKESLNSGITLEKTEAEKQRKRGEILTKISEKANFEMPEKLVEYEQERLFEDMKNQISQNVKISFEEYLASIKKTEGELKETFKKEAEKRIKSFLVLRQIGKQENIKIEDKEIEEEMNKNIKNYSKEELKKIDINQLKEYTKDVIHNEKVFQLLENLSQ